MDRIGHGDASGGDTLKGGDLTPLFLGCVPDLRTVQNRPELWSVADDRSYLPTRVLNGHLVPALVERVQTIPGRNQDPEHPVMLSWPRAGKVGYRRWT